MIKKTWVAIGDSFTYIDEHLDETNYRIQEGYVTKTQKLLPFDTDVIHVAINGGKTIHFVGMDFPKGDFYSILLGINDWNSCGNPPLGKVEDFKDEDSRTTIGCLGWMVRKIRSVAPTAPIFIASPVEHGWFIYQFDYRNNTQDTGKPNSIGIYCRNYGNLYRHLEDPSHGIYYVNTHDEAGFTPENAVKFLRRQENGKTVDVPFEVFSKEIFDPNRYRAYPYPKEAEDMTYDGLHPSEKGGEALAKVFAKRIKEVIR